MNIFLASQGRQFYRLFLFIGESNSGGYALNSEAPSNEIDETSYIKILNNTTLSTFDNLDIGTNNLVGHTGLSNGTTHGFELELSNRAESKTWYTNPTYLVKCGQGGSQVSQWATNQSYFTTFVSRYQAAQSLLSNIQFRTYILFSLGINDALAGTNVNTWKSNVITFLSNIRSYTGASTPIVMTEFQGMGTGGTAYDSYSTVIQEIASEVRNTYSVDVTGAGLRDANHWNYSGMKFVAGKMLDVIENL